MADRTTPPARKSGRRRRSRALRKTLRGFVLLCFAAFFVFVGTSAYILFSNQPVREAAGVMVTGGLSVEKAFPGKSEVNLLLLGKDEDRNNRGQVVETNGRTDTIIFCHVSFVEKQVSLLSIPRDTLARIPGYRGRHKINAANAYGGPDLAVQTVENLLDMPVDGYFLVDYRTFETIIDEMGGVDVVVDKPLHYDDNWGQLHIHLEPGPQRLDGRQALGLVRFRKSNDGHGDSDQERIARQQMLLASLRSRMLKPSNLVKAPGMVSTLFEESRTNLSVQQATSLVNFARSVPRENMRMEILPAVPTRTALQVDESRARVLLEELFTGKPAADADSFGG